MPRRQAGAAAKAALGYDAAMSRLLLLALVAAALWLVMMVVYSPRRWRQMVRQAKIVGFAYVAAILISAALRLLGWWDWS